MIECRHVRIEGAGGDGLAHMARGEVALGVAPEPGVPRQHIQQKTRGGKELWSIAREKTLTLRTRLRLQSISRMTPKGRRVSVAVGAVHKLLKSRSGREWARKLKYGYSPTGILLQIADEVFVFFNSHTNRGEHTPWWTIVTVAVNVSIFFFMAGEWICATTPWASWTPGMHNIFRFMQDGPSFSGMFLTRWGGRYLPDIMGAKKQWYRWFSACIVHASLKHLMSNMIMTCVYGILTERVYGMRIVAMVWCVSAVGGNMWSAVLDPDKCIVLVGASGGVFGYMGIYCCDLVVRWKTLKRPMLRLLFIMTVLLQFVYSALNEPSISYLTHLGGLMCGIACSVILLPDIENKILRRAFPVASGFIIILSLVVMPWCAYSGSIRSSSCDTFTPPPTRGPSSLPAPMPAPMPAPAPPRGL